MRLYLTSIVFFIFFSNAFSQYSPNDRQLVLTTFSRSFDKNTVLSYLNSGDPQKTNAALLSIAQSGDTLFAEDVSGVNFENHYKYICFALSELGECYTSSKFLREETTVESSNVDISRNCLTALGHTGNRNDFEWLENNFNNKKINPAGISLSLYNFFIRKIITKEEAQRLILKELTSSEYFTGANFESAFALYRTGGSASAKDFLLNELNY